MLCEILVRINQLNDRNWVILMDIADSFLRLNIVKDVVAIVQKK